MKKYKITVEDLKGDTEKHTIESDSIILDTDDTTLFANFKTENLLMASVGEVLYDALCLSIKKNFNVEDTKTATNILSMSDNETKKAFIDKCDKELNSISYAILESLKDSVNYKDKTDAGLSISLKNNAKIIFNEPVEYGACFTDKTGMLCGEYKTMPAEDFIDKFGLITVHYIDTLAKVTMAKFLLSDEIEDLTDEELLNLVEEKFDSEDSDLYVGFYKNIVNSFSKSAIDSLKNHLIDTQLKTSDIAIDKEELKRQMVEESFKNLFSKGDKEDEEN